MEKAQVLKCKCGKVFAACVEPFCYTDKHWLKDLSDHVKNGGEVDLVGISDFKFESCTCEKQTVAVEVNPNQIPLFT